MSSKSCIICNSNFNNDDSRVLYCSICRHDNLYYCHVCNSRSFTRLSNLKKHVEWCNNNKNYVIEITPSEKDSMFCKVGKTFQCLRCCFQAHLSVVKKHVSICKIGVLKFVDFHSPDWIHPLSVSHDVNTNVDSDIDSKNLIVDNNCDIVDYIESIDYNDKNVIKKKIIQLLNHNKFIVACLEKLIAHI